MAKNQKTEVQKFGSQNTKAQKYNFSMKKPLRYDISHLPESHFGLDLHNLVLSKLIVKTMCQIPFA
jgi:hypothetical protein